MHYGILCYQISKANICALLPDTYSCRRHRTYANTVQGGNDSQQGGSHWRAGKAPEGTVPSLGKWRQWPRHFLLNSRPEALQTNQAVACAEKGKVFLSAERMTLTG